MPFCAAAHPREDSDEYRQREVECVGKVEIADTLRRERRILDPQSLASDEPDRDEYQGHDATGEEIRPEPNDLFLGPKQDRDEEIQQSIEDVVLPRTEGDIQTLPDRSGGYRQEEDDGHPQEKRDEPTIGNDPAETDHLTTEEPDTERSQQSRTEHDIDRVQLVALASPLHCLQRKEEREYHRHENRRQDTGARRDDSEQNRKETRQEKER